MIIEKLLTSYMRYTSNKYLNFSNNKNFILPEPKKNKQYFLYIHIPFCVELCPYCSFYKVPFQKDLTVKYFQSLQEEIKMLNKQGYTFSSIYIGGGTPTVLPKELVKLITAAKKLWPVNQISVETNPDHISIKTCKMLKKAGVNRISLGVQTFNNKLLKNIGRFEKYGSGEEIKKRIRAIMRMFDTLNIDMIFNFPGQTLPMVINDVEIINELNVDQVTFYPLMPARIKKSEIQSRFGRINYSNEKMFYKKITKQLSKQYTNSTVWCFSRIKGMIDEYIIDNDEYIGIGAGSFSYINGTIFSHIFSINDYISQIQNGIFPKTKYKNFSQREQIRYDLLIKLFSRTLDLNYLKNKYGKTYWLYIIKELFFFLLTGAGKLKNKKLILTQKGQYYLLVMMREFFTGVNNFREDKNGIN